MQLIPDYGIFFTVLGMVATWVGAIVVENAPHSQRCAARSIPELLHLSWKCKDASECSARHIERRAPDSPKRSPQLASTDARPAASRCVAQFGQTFLNYLVKKYNTTSFIVFSIALVMIIAVILMAVAGGIQIAAESAAGDPTGFVSPC